MNIKISFAVTVCDEIEELKVLIPFLEKWKRKRDEIVIQYDSQSVTDEVMAYLDILPHKTIGFPHGGDFSNFKNNLKRICNGHYIFQIDADEIPNVLLMQNIHDIISQENVDVFYIPRVNTVKGIKQHHIDKWGWKMNDRGWINFPDYQGRIYRRHENIEWIYKIREQIIGFKTFTTIPGYEELALYHHKKIDRQEKQNKFYKRIFN